MIIETQLDETQQKFLTKLDGYRPDNQLEEDVTKLEEWMSKQPHLPKITDRKWLLHFIVGCKYNLHRSKQTIEAYFVNRAKHPEFICAFDKEQISFNRKNGSICMLPKLTPEVCRVMCTKINPIENDTKLDYLFYYKMFLGILDLQIKTEPMRGQIFLYDLEHTTLSEFKNMPLTTTNNFVNLCLKSFPVSVKGVHFINPPPFVSQIITFTKMLLPTKLKTRIYVHDTLETLYQFIPKNVLPDQYGGTAGDLEKIVDKWIEYSLANNEWLRNRPKADLSKCVDQSQISEHGIEGTFRKLEID